jgi:hypothetical protein
VHAVTAQRGRSTPSIAWLFAAVALVVAPAQARADGNSLIGYPQTNILAKKAFHVDWDTVGVRAGTNVFSAIGITYGLGSGLRGRNGDGSDKNGILGRSEIGIDYLLTAGPNVATFVPTNERFYLNFKTQLYQDDSTKTRVVAGVYNLGANSLATARELYLLVSEDRPWGKIQVGVTHAFGKEEGLKTPAGNADRTYFQLSYNRHIWQRLFGAFAGYSGKSTQSRQSVALAYYVDNSYKGSFAIGYLFYNDKSVRPSRNQVYFGFDYGFGGPAKP